jgi:hypothetical protein
MIQSIGEPPDRHAERVADLFLRHLFARQGELWANVEGSLHRKQMGSIVGQRRAVARFRRAAGDLALSIDLTPGSRGRYLLMFTSCMLWDVAVDEAADLDRPIPSRCWLAVGVAFNNGGEPDDWDCRVPLLITRHAIVRLAQRSGVRTIPDLLTAAKDLWRAALTLLAEVDATGDIAILQREGAIWRLPLANGPIAVIGVASTAGRQLIVKTILSADMSEASE